MNNNKTLLRKALRLIKAQERLLANYRTGTQPSEATFKVLDSKADVIEEIEEVLGL